MCCNIVVPLLLVNIVFWNRKNFNNITGVSWHQGTQLRGPLKPLGHQGSILLGGLQGDPNWSPIMPRGVSFLDIWCHLFQTGEKFSVAPFYSELPSFFSRVLMESRLKASLKPLGSIFCCVIRETSEERHISPHDAARWQSPVRLYAWSLHWENRGINALSRLVTKALSRFVLQQNPFISVCITTKSLSGFVS